MHDPTRPPEGIDWKRTINRFGWYIVGLAIGCVMVGLMLQAKHAFIQPVTPAPLPAPANPPAPTPSPAP